MRVLTLDDMDGRQRVFVRWFIGHEHHIAYDAHGAKAALDTLPRFDLAHLDHDLAEEHYLNQSGGLHQEPVCRGCGHEQSLHYRFRPDGRRGACARCECPGYEAPAEVFLPGTGMDVVDHIIGMPEELRPRAVIVHSYNVIRAPEMLRRLLEAGIRAYWIKFDGSGEPSIGLLQRIGALPREG